NSYWRTNNNSWANVVNSYSDNPFYFNKTFELDEGEHILEYYSVDYARNTEITNQVPIRIDLTNPEVNVGSDKSSTDSVDVDATTLDNLSGIDTYLWEKISGPGIITFSNEDEEDTEISADETGTYTIRLTVTDNAGNSNYDELDYTMEESKSSRGSRGGPVKVCEPNWTCSEWLECSIDEIQIRTCTDLEECNTNRDQPDLEQDCTYISPQEPEPVMPESVIPEINQTQNTTNTTNGNGVTGAVVGPIQGNPLGDFFGNFWDWLLGLF
ncbi:MAG: hypothetical protein KAQ83_04945, partial [Nanoarchaeota archaeon]|nr:hypothetical protein [Nanoarchaeota archaeon]